jgi:hypothetical protein
MCNDTIKDFYWEKKKQATSVYCPQETCRIDKDMHRLKVKEWKLIFQAKEIKTNRSKYTHM